MKTASRNTWIYLLDAARFSRAVLDRFKTAARHRLSTARRVNIQTLITHAAYIRHINPLMFDVIDDKPEGVAWGVYHVLTRARRARVYTLSHQPWAGLCVINPKAILHEGFILSTVLYNFRRLSLILDFQLWIGLNSINYVKNILQLVLNA